MQLAVRGFVVFFGLMLVGLGYFVGVSMAGEARSGAERAARLAPLDAAGVRAGAQGGEVLVEGVVAADNAARFRDFVAYVREEFRGAEGNGNERWIEDERLTPALLLDAGGQVRVANDDYELLGPHERWQEEGLNWSSRTQEGTKRYRGLLAGRPVMVIGALAPGAAGNEVRAELVFGGTRAEYLAGQQGASGFFRWLGLAIAALGAGLIVTGAWVLRRWR